MADSRYWSKDLITRFINTYKSYPCLWKIKSKEYTNKNLKNIAYEKLIEVCKAANPDANRDYVVKKIQSFRGSFRKEMKKIMESKRSGAGEEDIHVPTLWYFNLLLFTIDQETPNESDIDTEEGLTGDVNYGRGIRRRNSESLEGNEEEIEEPNIEDNNLHDTIADIILSERSTTPSTRSFNPNLKRKANAKPKGGKRTITQRNLHFMEYCKNQLKASNEIEEHDAVGISWGKKLKRMDPMQAILAEALINKVMTQGLLKRLTEATNISSEDY